jgi:hypothetical protein
LPWRSLDEDLGDERCGIVAVKGDDDDAETAGNPEARRSGVASRARGQGRAVREALAADVAGEEETQGREGGDGDVGAS